MFAKIETLKYKRDVMSLTHGIFVLLNRVLQIL